MLTPIFDTIGPFPCVKNDNIQNIGRRKKRLLEKIGRLDAGLLGELNAALNS